MFKFKIDEKSALNSSRLGTIATNSGEVKTPVFMPVGTVGAVKTIAPWELRELGVEIILGNTYHLYLRPGEQVIKNFGGLAKFNRWNGPVLTDSGGFQVFSLGAGKRSKSGESLVKITADGVEFRSHLDGKKHYFTPEKVIDIQLDLGSDIIMPLDVCPPSKARKTEVKKAVELSINWLIKSKKHLERKVKNLKLKAEATPALFGIIQGGIYSDLREYCVKKVVEFNLDGYSIGGLAVGESQDEMLEIVKLCDKLLPKNKPRYLMGVGKPDDIEKATKLGVDMFDCVLPTRLARHGVVYCQSASRQNDLTNYTELNLLKSEFRADTQPLSCSCQCPTCNQGFSRAYLHHLMKEKEVLGLRLLTLHNLWFYMDLIRNIRRRI